METINLYMLWAQNVDNADKAVHTQINPFADLDMLERELKPAIELQLYRE